MPTQQIHSQVVSTQPLVSFVITTYNLPAHLLQECLKSILALSLSAKEREIILVDDGSDISPLNDLFDYQDRIIYICQPNRGVAAARNLGITNAGGTYIQFVDGDDTLIPFAYDHCLDIIRYHDADLIAFDSTDRRIVQPTFSLQGPMSGSQYLNRYNLHAAVWSYLFRKNILNGLRFTTGTLAEDEEFTPQLILHAEKLYMANTKAYFYRQRNNSLVNDKSIRNLLKRLHDTEQVIYRFQSKLDALPQMERRAMNRRIAQLTMDYLYNIARFTHSSRYLEQAVDRLNRHGLFPLPRKNYTRKYQLFRRLIGTKTGRRLLIIGTLK